MDRPHFSQLLLQDGVITEEQLRAALKVQSQTGELIGSILFNRRILTEEQIVKYLSKVYEVPGVVVSQVNPDSSLREKVPKEIAHKYQILPLKLEKKVLSVASINPADLKTIQEVEFMTGCRLHIFVAMQVALKQRIEYFYGYGAGGAIDLPSDSGSEPIKITSLADSSSPNLARELLTEDLGQALSQAKGSLPKVAPDWQQIQKRQRTILVVDDDPNIRTLLGDGLQSKNYNVISASRGREAIQKIQNIRPDLVLLDAMLPEIHGFTICRTLKNSEKYRDIPVIIITAVYTGWRFALDVKEQYGADEVMEKPFKIQDVLAKVKTLLDESQSYSDTSAVKDMELTRKSETFLQSGIEALKVGKKEEALSFFRKGIEVDQFHPMLHYYLGKCAELANDLFGAIASFEKAVKLDPFFFVAVKDLAVLYQKNGFKLKSIEMWERALQVCPQAELKEKIKQNLLRLL